jgi:hypothetical protein
MKSVVFVSLLLLLGIVAASAQTNPVPFIDQPLVPTAASPGVAGFTLAISGANFVSGSVVNWNGVPLPTTFVNKAQVTAAVAASDVSSAGTVFVTIVNPAPGGGISNVAFFQVATPQSAVAFSPNSNLFSAADGVFNVIAADFNDDGKLDLAATGTVNSQNNPTLFIILGNGDGTFQAPVSYPISFPDVIVAPLITGDFNGDGKLDVIAGLTVLSGNGDGTFQLGATLPASIGSLLGAGDFNGDGKLDLAGFDNTNSQLTIMLGNGDGTFQAQTPLQVVSPGVYSFDTIVTADFNGDGVLDLAINGDGEEHGGSFVTILLGNGDGTFQAALLGGDEAQGSLGPVTAADFNGDGKQDLAGNFTFGQVAEPQSQSPGLAVGLGNGAGAFTFNNYPIPQSGGSIFSGDFNADGRLDLAMDSMIAMGNGNGTFQTPAIVAAGTFTLAVGDFNGDGRLDLVANDSTATAFVLLQTSVLLSPQALAYTNPLFTGIASAPQTTTLNNVGSAPLAISSVSITGTNAGDFAQTNNCPSTLAPNASCQISVTFKPTAGGARSANLQVAYNTTGSPQTVPLSGTGLDFALAVSGKTTATVTVTQAATYTISVTPEGGFHQTVAFTCSGALPAYSSCSVTPSSIALDGKSTATATVTVAAVSSAALMPPTRWRWTNRFVFGFLFYGALGMALLTRSRSVRRWRPQLLYGLLLLCLFTNGTFMTACGGNSGTSTGTYTLTITGTSTAGGVMLTHSENLTLVVQ